MILALSTASLFVTV